MADVAWIIERLKAMSVPEVAWRISQKVMQKKEQCKYQSAKIAVTHNLFDQKLNKLHLAASKMHLNYSNLVFSTNTKIPMLGGYDYEAYKKNWHAGFQTINQWPDEFSYFLRYKQRDDIGDARTNWELNRHFQFALLAKNYFASNDSKYLDEFLELFEDWNEKNPFLWGISWTSVMEIAIRCSNWCYSYCFLAETKTPESLLEKLRIGILNMADYMVKHYSRYSSANNHLIVEAYAIGQTGILFDYKPWIDFSIHILTRELPLQNYPDGINKEASLHYQSFYMEAMGLMMRLMKVNGIAVPDTWSPMITKMCRYMCDCVGKYGEVIAFGDNDEGKILDLYGGVDHYQYVLGLFSCLLPERYVDHLDCENLQWLFEKRTLNEALEKKRYIPPLCACYKEGGNTILRSRDGRILIGIDHGALGFGSIAAHGHADALSFQMFVDGQPVFVDPGTYIYHCDLERRNTFRKTENHNTVCVNGEDQSEMLGAFLWGRKAECKLLECTETENSFSLKAVVNDLHIREFIFDFQNHLTINDHVLQGAEGEINFILGSNANAAAISGSYGRKNVEISAFYGKKETAVKLSHKFNHSLRTEIAVWEE